MKYNIYQTIYDFLKKNKLALFGYLFLAISTPIAKIALPHYYGKIIDDISTNKRITDNVKNIMLIVLAIWVGIQVLLGINNWLDTYFIPLLQEHLRKHIIENILEKYKENYEEQEVGILITQIIKLPYVVKSLIDDIQQQFLPILVALVLSIGYFFWIDNYLCIISICSILFYCVMVYYLGNKCNKQTTEMNDEYDKLHEDISDTLGNLLNVYTSSGSETEINKIMEQHDNYKNKFITSMRCISKFRIFSNLIYLIMFFSINGYVLYAFSQGYLQVDAIVSVLIISSYVITELGHLANNVDDFIYNTLTIDQIQKTIDVLNKNKNDEYDINIIRNNPLIEFNNLTLYLGKNRLINNLNLIIKPNEKIAIMGKIGSGKSSLTKTLLRLYPYKGVITINGYDIKKFNIDEYRRLITYIPQQPKLFNRTIYENISYGNNSTKEQVRELFRKYKLNFDLEYIVGKSGEKISGGQRQIIHLLRSLLKGSKIIIMDEPSTSLDNNTKQFIFSILNDILVDRTLIIITHDPKLLSFVDRIITMENGNIISDKLRDNKK